MSMTCGYRAPPLADASWKRAAGDTGGTGCTHSCAGNGPGPALLLLRECGWLEARVVTISSGQGMTKRRSLAPLTAADPEAALPLALVSPPNSSSRCVALAKVASAPQSGSARCSGSSTPPCSTRPGGNEAPRFHLTRCGNATVGSTTRADERGRRAALRCVAQWPR